MKNDVVDESVQGFAENSVAEARRIIPAQVGDPALGPLSLLPGTWANIRPEHRLDPNNEFIGEGTLAGAGVSPFDGRGWNLIALPFIRDAGGPPFRVMMNQYNEVLHFDKVDDKVPNRGIDFQSGTNTDQEVAALDYTQRIRQIAAADDVGSPPEKGLTPEADIHHEPGFFLHMKQQNIDGFNIARLATIPHGNAANAIGKFVEFDGPPTIPPLSGMPEGASTFDALDEMERGNPYLAPYKFFADAPFTGVLSPPFPGFEPVNTTNLLTLGLGGIADKVVKTTELVLDTDTMEAGIVNIPFIERQADAALMRSTFWIMELDEEGPQGGPHLIMAYAQFIFLDFFPRQGRDGREGFIRWPHVSINMMEKIANPPGGTHETYGK